MFALTGYALLEGNKSCCRKPRQFHRKLPWLCRNLSSLPGWDFLAFRAHHSSPSSRAGAGGQLSVSRSGLLSTAETRTCWSGAGEGAV